MNCDPAAVARALRLAGVTVNHLELVRKALRTGLKDPIAGLWVHAGPRSLAPEFAHERAVAGAASGCITPQAHLIFDGPWVYSPWRYVAPRDSARPADLAGALATFHSTKPSPEIISRPSRLVTFSAAAFKAAPLEPNISAQLISRLTASAALLAANPGPLGTGLVHGDAHLGNVLVGETVLLCDLENAGWGARVLDLAPLYVEHRRYGKSMEPFYELVAAYETPTGDPWDPWADPAFVPAVELTEMFLAAWSLSEAESGDQAATLETQRRVTSLLGTSLTPWTRR